MAVPPPALRILLFASLRETAGWSERCQPLQPDDTPRRLWLALALPGDLARMRVAVNQQFVDADTRLQAGDELAFLPPISGG